jgi:peptide/nickel transport system substrate-binding protein
VDNDRNEMVEAALGRRLRRREFLSVAAMGGVITATGGLLAACSSSKTASSSPTTASTGAPKHGGNLRVAIVGGSTSDTLDAHEVVSQVDNLRLMALYNGLVQFLPNGGIAKVLAEEIFPNKDGSTWTIRLRPGVTFHDGKPLTAEDVVYTFKRIMDPKVPKTGAFALQSVDPNGMKIVDSRTITLTMLKPFSTFVEQIADLYYFGIVPVGYNPKAPVGTGPFKYKSFTPGQQSVFARNDNYFVSGLPYLDELTIIDSFQDPTSAQNAFTSGVVQAYTQAPITLARSLAGNSSVQLLISTPDQWVPFTMRVDQTPFRDVRVRQAFRYIIDRPSVVNSVFDGQAIVGNDVFCPRDPNFDHSLHRQQDIPLARHLLKSAGFPDLSIQLVTSVGIAPGAVENAQVFTQNAAAAGVHVNVANKTSTDYFAQYKHWTFSQSFWGNPPYIATIAQALLPTSPFNETHNDNPQYNKLYAEVNATTDPNLQKQLIREMQIIDFNESGYIIPAYNRQLDLLSPRVHGLTPTTTAIPMGNADWEHVWLG